MEVQNKQANKLKLVNQTINNEIIDLKGALKTHKISAHLKNRINLKPQIYETRFSSKHFILKNNQKLSISQTISPRSKT